MHSNLYVFHSALRMSPAFATVRTVHVNIKKQVCRQSEYHYAMGCYAYINPSVTLRPLRHSSQRHIKSCSFMWPPFHTERLPISSKGCIHPPDPLGAVFRAPEMDILSIDIAICDSHVDATPSTLTLISWVLVMSKIALASVSVGTALLWFEPEIDATP